MPYARLMQEVRLVAETAAQQERNTWRQSAFVGWQVVGSMGGSVGSFDKYLRKLGIQDPKTVLSDEQLEREKGAAFKNMDVVRRAFDGGTA